MIIKLSRFKVLPGKSDRVTDWMNFLRQNITEAVATLVDEKIFIESVFREVRDQEEYLYWYSVRLPGGTNVRDSNHRVDKIHLQFADECIDRSVSRVDLKFEVGLFQDFLSSKLKI